MIDMGDLAKELQKQANLITRVAASLKALSKAEGEPVQRFTEMQAEIKTLRKSVKALRLEGGLQKETEEAIARAETELSELMQAAKPAFGKALGAILQGQGLRLTGNYPELRAGDFTISADLKTGRTEIWYGPRAERLEKCGILPAEVAEALLRHHTEISGRDSDEEAFLGTLQEAYKICIFRTGNKTGDQVGIPEILGAFRYLAGEHTYSRAMLSHDLRSLETHTTEKLELRLVTAKRGEKGAAILWIPPMPGGRGGYISGIRFMEQE